MAFALIFLALVLLFANRGNDEDDPDDGGGRWSDLDDFKSSVSSIRSVDYDEGTIKDLGSVDRPEHTLYILMGVERTVNSTEYVYIRDFILRGGKVMIADDGTNANSLAMLPMASGEGEVRFLGQRYLTEALTGIETDPGYVYNRSFISSQANIGGSIYDLVIHSPMGLNFTGTGNPVLKTTKQLTVVDRNDNGIQDLEDLFMPFGAIAVEYSVGENGGGVVYFSSTGLFTDNVFSLRDNEQFVRSYILTLLPEGGDLILDQSKEAQGRSPHRAVIPDE